MTLYYAKELFELLMELIRRADPTLMAVCITLIVLAYMHMRVRLAETKTRAKIEAKKLAVTTPTVSVVRTICISVVAVVTLIVLKI